MTILTWLAIISPTLISFIIETKEGSLAIPLRESWGLGYDQTVIQVMGEFRYSNFLTALAQFIGEGKEHIISNFESIFRADKARIGVRSPGGSIYWKKNLSKICDFILSQNEKPLVIGEAGLYGLRRPFHVALEKTRGCLLFDWCKLMQQMKRKKKKKKLLSQDHVRRGKKWQTLIQREKVSYQPSRK